MWDEVVAKLARLEALDMQCQVFGADHHRYRLFPCLPKEDLSRLERWLGVPFPDELRAFYRDVGNGVAGPYYGLREAEAIKGYNPSKPYTQAATLRAFAQSRGLAEEGEDYFELGREYLAGLITIIDEGCGHEVCLVTTGLRAGEVVRVSLEGYVYETNQTLIKTYDLWLDREIEKFETVRRMMSDGSSVDEINQEVRAKFDTLDGEDVIASIANVEKPVELFGTAHHKIYHGATQTPWYENVLCEWQKTNTTS